ncbi:hypothetical protein [Sphingomonas xinjiangensis]|uniref:Uncharacterized protein n=1 Tax=Sphingomonas xinjiangensis TaxID=643568 RepID=A0A840YDG7_9SPHN|nr:hypothetical protein [Sphingomonas xinjiangensis]MBB5710894.1 hypothetical protein [Sphingomonas xinjiangensis]
MILTLAAAAMPLPQAERSAVLDTAHQAIERRIGKRAKLLVRTLNSEGDWAFLVAAMQDPTGKPISYAGTSLASAEAEGMISKDYAALMKRQGGGWRIVVQALGPTDVAWAGWAGEHGAPAALFR